MKALDKVRYVSTVSGARESRTHDRATAVSADLRVFHWEQKHMGGLNCCATLL